MSTRLDKRLKSVWTHPLAKPVRAHKLFHQGISNNLSHCVHSNCSQGMLLKSRLTMRKFLSLIFSGIIILFQCRYYFSNEATKSNPDATRHELWKGLILGIRTLPAHLSTEALIEVQWFWSKHDIEELFEKKELDIPDCMRR
jgi:hypothetical protein